MNEHIETVLRGQTKDLGAIEVRRVLPPQGEGRRMIGPFIFFDEFGPAILPAGKALDVRPHPHINLATVSYLFEGEVQHKDSLGNDLAIEPGAINWMTAGRGIVHSERTPEHLQAVDFELHGIQLWVALPSEHEEVAPSFVHYPADSIPTTELEGVKLRVMIGETYGLRSPVETLAVMFYVDAQLPAGRSLALPNDYSERAAYVVEGGFRCGERSFTKGDMVVFHDGCVPRLESDEGARLMLLGGEPVGERLLWWNFVSSSAERMDEAKRQWAAGPGNSERFGLVPGDTEAFIPLPDRD